MKSKTYVYVTSDEDKASPGVQNDALESGMRKVFLPQLVCNKEEQNVTDSKT